MFLKYNLPAIIICVAIFILCMLPGSKVPHYAIPHLDKIAHIVLFGSLGFSLLYGFNKQIQFAFFRNNSSIIACVFGIAYGIFIEICQDQFVPSRAFELADIVADTVGVLSAFLLFKKVKFVKSL